jgi:hypothetical protein
MARLTASQFGTQFDKRHEVRVKAIWSEPEVREALRAIGVELEALRETGGLVAGELGLEQTGRLSELRKTCHRHGLVVRIVVADSGKVEVLVSLSLKAEHEELSARPFYMNDPMTDGEFDLWEISRDAPITRIVQDLTFRLRRLRGERRLRGAVRLKFGGSTSRTDLFLRAIEVYRRRLQGDTWAELEKTMQWTSSPMRRAVSLLLEATGLPRPAKGVILPDRPREDCDGCKKRTSPMRPCAGCPYVAYVERVFESLKMPEELPRRGPRK